MKRFLLIALALFAYITVQASGDSPKREMRSGWLTTVFSIDWPYTKSTGNTSQINAQKTELRSLLDKLKSANINTVFFQARARADAMYASSYEPWSVDLSGGRGTNPGYDPLAYAIEEAHKRGMELHTWINPYRFESTAGAYSGQPGDYSTTNPDWVLKVPTEYDKGVAIKWGTMLDPGNPNVRQRIKNIIREIVTNYDIDGVVFDDYFYMEYISNEDANSQASYKPATTTVADWRRGNVNLLISEVNTEIKSIKPYVLFGVGPRGYWSTSQTVADSYGVTLPATNRQGSNTYAAIYCDALAWMKAKTIDYISPQIYWATTSDYSYTILSKWWSDVANKFGTQVYVSQYLSEIDYPTKSALKSSVQIDDNIISTGGLSQLEYLALLSLEASKNTGLKAATIPGSDFLIQVNNNREYDKNGAPGSVFYSCNPFLWQPRIDLFANNVFQNKSLRPAMWVPFTDQTTPTNLRIEGDSLKWDYSSNNVRYVVYAIPNGVVNTPGIFAESTYLQDISYSKSYAVPAAKPIASYTYAVSVLDRYGNEFAPIVYGSSVTTGTPLTLSTPVNGSNVVLPFNFKWQTMDGVEYYIFELAEDASFQTSIYKREITATELSSTNMGFLKADHEYYWRVKAVKASTTISVSDTWKIQAGVFNITTPANNDVIVNTPVIKWTQSNNADYYLLQIATSNAFAANAIVYSKQLTEQEHTVPANTLISGTVYYIRVAAVSGGINTYSDIIKVTVETNVPSVPVITSPAEGETITGTSINVKWEDSPYADRFRVELSTTDQFMTTTVKNVNPFIYETVYTGLTPGEYYLRIRARYALAYNTAWSVTRKVILTDNTSIETDNQDNQVFRIVSDNGSSYLEINLTVGTKVSASIYNLSGVKMFDVLKNEEISGTGNRFELPSGLNKGIYIVRINTGKENNPLKWIK